MQDRRQIKRQVIKQLNTAQKKQTQNTAKQNYPGSVASYDTRPGNEVGLFYNAPKPTWANEVRSPRFSSSRLQQDTLSMSVVQYRNISQCNNLVLLLTSVLLLLLLKKEIHQNIFETKRLFGVDDEENFQLLTNFSWLPWIHG